MSEGIRAKRNLNLGLITAEFYRVGVIYNQAVGNIFHSGFVATVVIHTKNWEGISGYVWEFSNIYADLKRLEHYYTSSYNGAIPMGHLAIQSSPTLRDPIRIGNYRLTDTGFYQYPGV